MAKPKTNKAGIGHNSVGDDGGVAQDQLRSFVERIERLEEEKKTISDDIKDVYAEAKGNGFDTKVLRALVARRRLDQSEREAFDAMLETYEGVFN